MTCGVGVKRQFSPDPGAEDLDVPELHWIDVENVVALTSQLHANLKLLANLSGELRLAGTINNTQVNIYGDPRYKIFEERLLDLVRAHPEIKEDVLNILTEVEASPKPNPPNGVASRLPMLIDANVIEEGAHGA